MKTATFFLNVLSSLNYKMFKWSNGLRETVFAMIVFGSELLLKSNKNFKQNNLLPPKLYFDEKKFCYFHWYPIKNLISFFLKILQIRHIFDTVK